MNMPLFLEITIICTSLFFALPLLRKWGIATLTDYTVIGLLVSALLYVLGLELSTKTSLMEWSALALMFFLGFQLKPSTLTKISKDFLIIYSLATICLAGLLTSLILAFTTLSLGIAILLGLAFSISSLVWMLGEFNSTSIESVRIPYFHYWFLLLQSAIFTIVLMLVPIISTLQHPQHIIGYTAGLIALCSGLVWLSQTWFIRYFHWIAKHKSTELSIVFVLGIAFAIFTLLQITNISVLFGALLLGIILADAPFKAQLEQILQPWKGIAIGLFFLSIALQLDFKILTDHLYFILSSLSILLVTKWLVWFVAIYYQTRHLKSSLKRAVDFAHTGEATLILILLLFSQQIFNTTQAQVLSWIVILIILIYPIIQYLQSIAQLKTHKKINISEDETQGSIPLNTPPIIIAGFGRFGQLLARIAHLNGLSFIAIDHSQPEMGFLTRYKGQFIQADLTDEETLAELPLQHNPLFILAIDDVEDSVYVARYLNLYHPQITVLARARHRHHAQILTSLGIAYIWQENRHSAFVLAQKMLTLKEQNENEATKWLEEFEQYDSQLLNATQGSDLCSNVSQSEIAFIAELENLFENDAHVYQSRKKQQSLDDQSAT